MEENSREELRQLVREEVERVLAHTFNAVADLINAETDESQDAPEGAR